MDQIVSREEMRARGAKAFDEGRGVDSHNMNWMSPAVADWQAGWHQRRIERSRKAGNQIRQVLAMGCPP
jgi:hypothetical protein